MRRGTRLSGFLVLALAHGAGAKPDDLSQRWKDVPRITIKSDKIKVAAAVRKICKKAGASVLVDTREDYKIALDLKGVTFFQALDEVAKRAGLALKWDRSWGDGGYKTVLRLVAQPDGMKRVAPVHDGPARLELVGIYAQRSAGRLFSPQGKKPDNRPSKLWVEMRCAFEHGFENVFIKEVVLESATDDTDRSLLGERTRIDRYRGDHTFRIDLKVPDRGSLKVQDLRGRLVLYLPMETLEFKYTGGSRKSTKKAGDARFIFHKISRKGGDDGRPLLEVDLDGHPCKELANYGYREMSVMTDSYSSRQNVPVGIYLYDKVGEGIGTRGRSYSSGSRTSVKYTLDSYPHRILVRVVTRVAKKEIPFRFTDLPIPR